MGERGGLVASASSTAIARLELDVGMHWIKTRAVVIRPPSIVSRNHMAARCCLSVNTPESSVSVNKAQVKLLESRGPRPESHSSKGGMESRQCQCRPAAS